MHHPKIIGRKGLVVKKIREDHGCRIQFPEKGDENQNVITIVGYEDKTHLAKEDILKIVKELVCVCLFHSKHSKLCVQVQPQLLLITVQSAILVQVAIMTCCNFMN